MMYLFSDEDAPSIDRPPVLNSMLAPAACVARVVKSRPLGSESMNSSRMLVARTVLVTSTGASPVTVTSSCTVLTRRLKSTLRFWPRERWMSCIFTVVKPGSVAVRKYVPARRAGKV
jgi:hypothetical protein